MAIHDSIFGVLKRLGETFGRKKISQIGKFQQETGTVARFRTLSPSRDLIGGRFPGAIKPTVIEEIRQAGFDPGLQTLGELRKRTSFSLPSSASSFVGETSITTTLATGACDALSGIARSACLLIMSRIPGAGTGGTSQTDIVGPTGCPSGMVKIGNKCLDLTALPPGGDPALVPATGATTVGAFGLPASFPAGISRVVRSCGPRMVLGIDNLCYPKAVLPPRSKFRKWRRPPRVPVTRRDVVAIRRSAGAKDRVAELAKDVGLKLATHRRKKK